MEGFVVCGTCGTTNAAGAKFCVECGARLASACPTCGASNQPGAKFCAECGTRLSDAAAAPAAQPGSRPAAAAPSADARPAGVPGLTAPLVASTTERRLVSVLFADLVGFTALAADRDPEAVRELLGRYFDTARDIIERYGGTVEKFIGDAVMAVWGTPIAREDDAELAVRSALELVEAVRELDSGADGRGLEARAGVLTGEAAVTIGAAGQAMVAGDLVNTASRLQSVAAPGTVLVGEATQRAASGAIVFEPVGDQTLKGKPLPVPAWRAVRVVAKRGGQGRSTGLEAPFVGRDDELRLLKDFFHATSRERRARLISVIGQAGIGKTRLAWEFLKYLDGFLETVWYHEGRSPAFGEGVTFWALGEMVRRRAGLVENDDETTTRAGIASTLAEFVPNEAERQWIEPALLALLGFGDAEGRTREELFAAWRTFFERIATDYPAVLVFEDLQWADPGLLDFIDHLLEWSTKSPIFVVALSRPELLDRRPDWGAGRRNYVALSLGPLTETSMRELLAGLVPGLPPAAVRTILERADGIPLYAVETVRMLVSDGKLEEIDGAYRPVADLGDLAVPETLHALIAARLDALDPTDRAILQDGAVLGQTFTVLALAAMRDDPPDELEPRLRNLVRREVLVLDTDPRSPERGQYGFSQALLRDVAYGTLAKRDRRIRHLAAARYFESLGDESVAGMLATHYLDAHAASPDGPEADAVAAQARIALRAAADRAMALGSHDQGIAYLERALTVTADPVDESATLQRIALAASQATRADEAEAAARRALAIELERGDPTAIARAHVTLGNVLVFAYRTTQALEALEPFYPDLAAQLGDEPVVAELGALIARAHHLHEDPEAAIAWADRALATSERLYLLPVLAGALATKGGAMTNRGRVWEGLGLIGAALKIAETNGFLDTRLRAMTSLSGIMAAYDPRQAWEVARDAYEVAHRLGLRHNAVLLASNGGEAALSIGELEWASRVLGEMGALELGPVDRSALEGVAIEIDATRGEPVADRLDALAAMGDESDSVFGSSLRLSRLMHAFAESRFEDAYVISREIAAMSQINRPYALVYATNAAVRARDLDRAVAANAELVALGVRGPNLDALRHADEAGILALRGHWPEAVEGFREATRSLRERGVEFDLGRALLTMVELAPPGDAAAMAAADEAEQLFSRMGATPWVEQVARARGDGAPDVRAARTVAIETGDATRELAAG